MGNRTTNASDLNGLPNGTAVGVLVYASNGTTLLYSNASAATLTDGQASFRLPYALTAGTNYVLKAQVTDLAGNQGTSAAQNLSVTSVSAFAYAARQLVSDPLGGDSLDQLGDARLSAALNLDQSGGGAGGYSALVYNSDAVSSRPIIQATINTPNNASLPATITATLTWNGTAGSAQNFSTTGMSPGDVLTLAVQVPSAVTTTGRYAWSMLIQISGQPNQTITGSTFVVAQDASPFGAGWTFGATDRLVDIPVDLLNGLPAGKLFVSGAGEYRFFAGTTSFTGPADDNGTLALVGGNYVYTTPDGRTETFNALGLETQAASADGQETLAFRYDVSNRLTGMTAIDGALTTFSYTSTQDLIQSVNSRVTTLALDTSGNLTQVTNPDGGLHTYSYDTGHRLTGETFAGLQNEWAYATNGALTTMTAGSAVVGGITNLDYTALTPADVQGLGALVAGTVMATEKDPNGHTTGLQLDAQGRTLKQVAPDGGGSPYQYDANGRVTVSTDPLGRATTYQLDSLGYVTLETFPDGSTEGFQYQTAFHALISMTDQRGQTTTSAYDASGHLTSTTDALSETTRYGYNAAGLETSVTDPLNHTTTFAYDANRRLTTTTDALNNVTSFAYDANGYGLTTTDPLGRVTTTNYDVMGRLTKTTDALGSSATMAYNAAGLELSATDALGRLSQPVYDTFNRGLVASTLQAVGTPVQISGLSTFDSAGQTTKTRNANGAWTNQAFDPLGRVTQTTNALNGKSQTMFDKAGQTPAMRDELGRLTQQGYDVMGRVTTTTDSQGNVTTTAYDLGGNVTAVTDPLGHTTTTLYDALGRVTTTIDPLGHRATTTYDAAGNLSTTTDFNGHLTSYAYDADNRRTTVTDPLGNVTSTAYDAVGNVTAFTDPLGHTTTSLYDALNRATVSIDSLGHRTTAAYDKLGDVTTVTDPLNKTVSYAYDQLNRLLTTVNSLGLTTTQIDDANGNRIAAIDPLGNYTQTVNDALDRPIETVDLRGAVTQTKPDAAGQTTAVTDAVGNTTQYLYDTLGRRTVAIDPLGARTTTTYDSANRVSTITDRDSREQVYHYDNANRVTAETWLSSAGVTVNLLTYSYDNIGNQLTAADYNGTVTSAYDSDNRLTAQTDVFGLTLTYQYDTESRLTLRSDSKGGVLTYVYDTSNRLTSEQFGGSGMTQARVDLGYDNRNELTSLTRYTDVAGGTLVGTTAYAYDDSSRLTSIVNKTGANATLSYYQYTLDNASRVTQESWQSLTTTGSVISGTHTYAYDATSQLTAADGTVYSQDLNGNHTMAGYQTGTANRLSNDGVFTYTYDSAGNLTQQSKGAGLETWYYTYDTLNRLTSIEQTTNGTTLEYAATYTYDVAGREIEQDEWKTGGTTTITRTAYDMNGVAWADLDGTNTVQTRYLAGPGVNQWLARIDASGLEWLGTDRLGTVRDVVNGVGTMVLDHAEFGAFGAVTSDTNAAAAGLLGFQGEFDNRYAGQVKMGVRWYNTRTMQWDQEDPTPTQINAGDGDYRRFVGNDPTNGKDPSGLIDPEYLQKLEKDGEFRSQEINALGYEINRTPSRVTAILRLFLDKKLKSKEDIRDFRNWTDPDPNRGMSPLASVFHKGFKPVVTNDAATEKRIEKLITDLGDDDFTTREKATEELAKLGNRAGKQLIGASKGRDAERADRAKKLLQAIEDQGLPADPDDQLIWIDYIEMYKNKFSEVDTENLRCTLTLVASGDPKSKVTSRAKEVANKLVFP